MPGVGMRASRTMRQTRIHPCFVVYRVPTWKTYAVKRVLHSTPTGVDTRRTTTYFEVLPYHGLPISFVKLPPPKKADRHPSSILQYLIIKVDTNLFSLWQINSFSSFCNTTSYQQKQEPLRATVVPTPPPHTQNPGVM